MATTKLSESQISELAAQLGVPEADIAAMSHEEILEIINSGDLEPSQKIRLIQSRLAKHRDEAAELSDLADAALDEMESGDEDEVEDEMVEPV